MFLVKNSFATLHLNIIVFIQDMLVKRNNINVLKLEYLNIIDKNDNFHKCEACLKLEISQWYKLELLYLQCTLKR